MIRRSMGRGFVDRPVHSSPLGSDGTLFMVSGAHWQKVSTTMEMLFASGVHAICVLLGFPTDLPLLRRLLAY